jgi:hypothetical protein
MIGAVEEEGERRKGEREKVFFLEEQANSTRLCSFVLFFFKKKTFMSL